ncbi:hypothetical protein J5839_05810 [Methanosarcinaceae archaeon]|nr:hypothetical protein [Methanosarcinaceae archaeon]
MADNSLMEKVRAFLLTVPGIEECFVIDEEMKEEIDRLEEQANGQVLMGMGEGDNQGMKAVAERQHMIGFTTNRSYVWPEPPNVIMMQGDMVIGFDCSKEQAAEYEKTGKYAVIGTFVMPLDAKPKTGGKPKVILPAKPYPLVEENCGVRNAVIGSPSTPSDDYIHEKLPIAKKEGNGTVFLGFDE